ncbi:hypothetical protein G6F16_012132 [Rhizopus arrhizus]|nr:hypothetical protein G6F24_001287 [Rhizopus arrhizus]KAG0780849.1 hypothetical protein G6F22_009864 [Rhizopus arrhizus]KAG0795286.1 hypothetical protein G6F21_002217 [Rhizopus arrhizus]KAG0816969.1 hypothetical protein G6F20_002772 [Rhizopus arrhizus]KAG0821069.1 hypothetical protein G6F19_012124 [Rhizopus arrhizus]
MYDQHAIIKSYLDPPCINITDEQERKKFKKMKYKLKRVFGKRKPNDVTMSSDSGCTSTTAAVNNQNESMLYSRLSFCGVPICSFRNKSRQPVLKSILKKPNRKRWSTCTLQKKLAQLHFDSHISVYETYSRQEYDRSSDAEAVCTRLTPMIAQEIKQELNHFKLYEMPIHESSRMNTHFFI